MKNFNWNKIEELKVTFDQSAEQEIEAAESKGDELSDEDLKVIRSKYTYKCDQLVKRIFNLGPKRLWKNDFMDGDGWRAGFTKPPLSKRVKARRKKNKAARLARKINRIK